MGVAEVYSALREASSAEASPERAAIALADRAESLLLDVRADTVERQSATLDRWAGALDRLELLHVGCVATGAAFAQRHGEDPSDDGGARLSALEQLWESSVIIGSETLALLRAGLPDGALARWRTLHEVAVLSLFVGATDDETAERLWWHTQMRAIKGRHDYQRWAEHVGEERLARDELRQMGKATGDLIAAYGEEFRGDYGWAHRALMPAVDYRSQAEAGKRRRGPFFTDLEAAVGLDHERIWFTHASGAVHIVLKTTEDDADDSFALAGSGVARSLWAPTAALALSDVAPADHPAEDKDQSDLVPDASVISQSHGEFGELVALLGALSAETQRAFDAADPPS